MSHSESFNGHTDLRDPNLVRVVFHPAGFGINLAEFMLCLAANVAVVIENHSTRTGCALVKSKNVFQRNSP
jgi:hypothetical protein